MTTQHPSELDSGAIESVTSSPRSDNLTKIGLHDDVTQPRVRFMCSFGGKILPRPHDNQLRYVGGDTRIVAVHRHTTFSSLLNKLSKLSGTTNISVKYQLPNEDLDALITVTTDEDVENMLEEFERIAQNHSPHSKAARLRLFLFATDAVSRASSISSLLDGSAKREHWFLDALNGGAGPGLERGRSEVSSIVSEVPDYLFGLDNSDDPPRDPKFKPRLNDNVSVSDPGSPAPVVYSPFCSTSSSLGTPYLPSIPDLRPVRTKPNIPSQAIETKETQTEGVVETGDPTFLQQPRYVGNPTWHYVQGSHFPGQPVQNFPVYYIPGSGPHENVSVQPAPIRPQYVQQCSAPPGQIPYGLHQPISDMGQVYGREARPPMDPYEISGRVVRDGLNQPVYYGVRNVGAAPVYPGVGPPEGEEIQVTRPEAKTGRVSWSS